MTIRRAAAAEKTIEQVRQVLDHPQAGSKPDTPTAGTPYPGPGGAARFADLPEYEILKIHRAAGDITGIANPFHRLHDGRATHLTSIGGRRVVNFSSYDYLGLNGHPAVMAAAKAAIDHYGTSVSASRLAGGERQVHRDLEIQLARLHDAEDALAFVGGHATNVTVIGTLLGPDDLIVCDAHVHNSVIEGARLCGAKRILCPHGDIEAIGRALKLNRARHRRVLVVVEGLYSMDGDIPPLTALVAIKQRYDAWLMVDEAHSIGVLGTTGKGIAEEQAVDAKSVDIWMGTLSKSFAASGGYIAGSRALIELLKYTSAGFVFSVGLSPPLAAAARTAIEIMHREPWRLTALRRNGIALLAAARARGLDTGLSAGAAIVPIIVGSSPQAVILSQRLLEIGFNVVPALFPGVPENEARLRFLVTSEHEPGEIVDVLDATAEEIARIRNGPSFVRAVAGL